MNVFGNKNIYSLSFRLWVSLVYVMWNVTVSTCYGNNKINKRQTANKQRIGSDESSSFTVAIGQLVKFLLTITFGDTYVKRKHLWKYKLYAWKTIKYLLFLYVSHSSHTITLFVVIIHHSRSYNPMPFMTIIKWLNINDTHTRITSKFPLYSNIHFHDHICIHRISLQTCGEGNRAFGWRC